MIMHSRNRLRRGGTSILAVFFVTLFAVLAISFTAMSNINLQMSKNHHEMNAAQAAAESGLQYANYLVGTYETPSEAYSMVNTVSQSEAEETFGYFVAHAQNLIGDSVILDGNGISWDNSALELRIPATGDIAYKTDSIGRFALLFRFEAGVGDNPHRLIVESVGVADGITRGAGLAYPIGKDTEVLEYAIASRGRMWLTGDTNIQGDIFSSWDRADISPFNITSDSRVEGTINTVLTLEQIQNEDYQMETLDEDDNPMFDGDGNRIYSPEDEVQGYHEGINYDQPCQDVPGMDIADYDTDMYNDGSLTEIPYCPSSDRETEYFPHVAGNYNAPSQSWSRVLDRHVYENQTFTNAKLPNNRNALFRNCTFEGILYVDCSKSGSTYYNNVRFENCNFNGPIITDVPEVLKWQNNCLYFTGTATFQNTAMAEATILAPHFNVNLGNTNSDSGDNNVLSGAIVGGIVDVRGNATINGTIISMCDTTVWSSGYVTNIGATMGDGGSETTEPGDVGTICITPDPGNMLPSGMRTPIVIMMDGNSYVEF
ncbi:MAG: pilus assembly PilX N-terminal domain-containing protein [Sedimentisphaerales bacterium]|nr:pilus assembly PilX N-terminal domain-containing protein [Sedimentisphaerales bacterium]